jgi:hypothetical protein
MGKWISEVMRIEGRFCRKRIERGFDGIGGNSEEIGTQHICLVGC